MDIRRVSLGAAIICYLAYQGASKSLDVVWISPVEGTLFSPGDTIVAKWTSSSILVSPSFKLCAISGSEKGISSTGRIGRSVAKDGDEDGSGKCGPAIWPQVRQAEDGYMVTITAPDTVEANKLCLEMQDDFGNIFASPAFELGSPSSDEVITSGLLTTPTSTLKTSDVAKSATRHSSDTNSGLSSSATASIPRLGIPVPSVLSLPSTQPDVLASRRPVSSAAVAVPLSVVSCIILVAGLLGYRTRRALARDRDRELKSYILSHQPPTPEGYGYVGEVQRAISVLSSRKGLSGYPDTSEPSPLFGAKSESRTTTRDPYNPMAVSVSSGSLYDHTPALHSAGPQDIGRGKSLTAQYTAAGTIPEAVSSQTLPFSSSTPDIPPSLLPARMSPLHIRTEYPAGDCPPLPRAPVAPISCLSPSGSTNVYDILAAKLKGYQ